MALVAERIHGSHRQHARILRAMRVVAAQTANAFDRSVLKDKGSAHIGMATSADRVGVCRSAQVVIAECSVDIMAVRTLHHALIDRMMKRHGELRLNVGMASVAKLGLRRNQQVLTDAGVVYAVAAQAIDAGTRMWRTHEVRMRILMAVQAAHINCPRRCVFKTKDLRYIASALDVGQARTVTVFAAQSIVAMQQNHARMRIVGKAVRNVGMAGLADGCAHIAGRQFRLRRRRCRAVSIGQNQTGGKRSRSGAIRSKDLWIRDCHQPKQQDQHNVEWNSSHA